LQSQGIKIRSCIRIPSLVTENLLTGVDGLIPRKNINFLFLALRKGEYTNEDLLDDIF